MFFMWLTMEIAYFKRGYEHFCVMCVVFVWDFRQEQKAEKFHKFCYLLKILIVAHILYLTKLYRIVYKYQLTY